MTFYEILGIDPSATPTAIRAAYRKKASELHPDKNHGKTGEEMALVQQAYDCLSDPTRRKMYDSDGVDLNPATIQSEALDLVTRHVNLALDEEDPEILASVYGSLVNLQIAADGALLSAKLKRKNLAKRVGRFKKKKEGDNLIHRLIEKKITGLDVETATLKRQQALLQAAFELVADYSEAKEERSATFGMHFIKG